MRIIAGIHKSRKLNTLEGNNTRPMMDRMKESVFNTIGPYFDDITTLDLFGGSGALSLESISRGAKKAYIVEKNYQAAKVIKSNIDLLKENEKVILFNMDYQQALKKFINALFPGIAAGTLGGILLAARVLHILSTDNFQFVLLKVEGCFFMGAIFLIAGVLSGMFCIRKYLE